MFPSFEIFGRQIGLYGIMVVVGGFVCAILGSRLIKRYGFDVFDWSILLLSIGAGIFLGAHILFSLTNIQTLILTFQHIGELCGSCLFPRSAAWCFTAVFSGDLLRFRFTANSTSALRAVRCLTFTPCWCRCFMCSAESAVFSAAAATVLNHRSASPFTETSSIPASMMFAVCLSS